MRSSRLIHTYHVMSMPRPWRAPTMPFWKQLIKATAQHGRGAAWYVWINIRRRETACGRPAQFRLLPATTWSSTKIVIRISNWNAAGQCASKQRLSWTRSWLFWCGYMSVGGKAVAQWLRCCATNRKVAGSIPAGVTGIFVDIKSFRSHYDPGVDSASNRNEYNEHFLGVKSAGA